MFSSKKKMHLVHSNELLCVKYINILKNDLSVLE